jgi:hypothetical protein
MAPEPWNDESVRTLAHRVAAAITVAPAGRRQDVPNRNPNPLIRLIGTGPATPPLGIDLIGGTPEELTRRV